MKQTDNVSLDFRSERSVTEERYTQSWQGYSAETVRLPDRSEFAYAWTGTAHYLAIHDLRLVEGETILDEEYRSNRTDLRSRMTFVPKGCEVRGWSRLTARRNSFTALYYDPALIAQELETKLSPWDGRPLLYFEDAALQSTLFKIESLLKSSAPAAAIHAETLGLLAAIELLQILQRPRALSIPRSGRLSSRHERMLRDFIEDNLHQEISLSQLASMTGLSRFHFARAFKRTFGFPPHAFVLRCRLDRAKRMLADTDAPVGDVAKSLGFGSLGQFSTVFRKSTGCSPLRFRRGG